MPRIVLNTFGSFGDLHPFLAIAIELKRRRHVPVIATSEIYRSKVEAEAISFAPIRPDVGSLAANPVLLERIWHPARGTESLLKEVILPQISESFEDLSSACSRADLLLTHTAALAGPVVAEKLKLPWLSVVLQPMAFFSAYDPPVLAPALWLRNLYPLGRWPFRIVRAFARWQTSRWTRQLADLRRRLGLPVEANPLFEGQFSQFGTVALFSHHFAAPQPDWPVNVTPTGFAFYDRFGVMPQMPPTSASFREDLDAFLAAGPPPAVFTLGSSAVMRPGEFFEQSLAAVRTLGMRAVLLAGPKPAQEISHRLPASVFVAPYAPYSALLPRAALTIHQGGIGTTSQALNAGRPMLVVPWAHDQPDNAERLRKLGVARVLNRRRYSAKTAAREIRALLETPRYMETAARFRDQLAAENGVSVACDRIETALTKLPLLAN